MDEGLIKVKRLIINYLHLRDHVLQRDLFIDFHIQLTCLNRELIVFSAENT